MRKDIVEEIEIPEGVEVELEHEKITLKKGDKTVERSFKGFSMKKIGNILKLGEKLSTKKEKKLLKTTASHLRNTLKGFEKNYVYKLQVCNVHFPMNVSYDKNKHEVVIKNFLGEVKPRIAKMLKNVEVKVDKEIITLQGFDKESVGQSAANIEKASRVRNRDRRNFQDGIFLTDWGE